MFLVFPPAGWTPRGWKPPIAAAEGKKTDYMRDEMSKNKAFYGLWICYVIGALAGLMAIGVAKPAGLEVAANAMIVEADITQKLTDLTLIFAFCNAVGRPLFGTLTDKLTPPRTAILSYVIIIAASLLMYTNPASITMYTVAFALLWLCLGGWLAGHCAGNNRELLRHQGLRPELWPGLHRIWRRRHHWKFNGRSCQGHAGRLCQCLPICGRTGSIGHYRGLCNGKTTERSVNYRVLKGVASHFIANTCITDMRCSGFGSMGATGCSIPEMSMFLEAL